jgi:hypothetical protein
MVPMATDSSRKISGAVDMIHLTVFMIAFPSSAFRLKAKLSAPKPADGLIQINPGRRRAVAYGPMLDPRYPTSRT